MKTISAYSSLKNHGLNQSITKKNSYKNHKYYQNYDKAAGDINRNAIRSQAEYQRDACEEELYRLRYGIENLLANNEQGDFKARQQQQRFTYEQNPLRTMTNRINDLHNRKNESWIERCSPCCRRWRRNKYDDDANIYNEYAYRRVYNDRNYDLPTRRTPEPPVQPELYSDSYVSTSPSPLISPRYIDPNRMHHTKNDLRRSIDNLISRNTSNKTNVSNLLTSKEMNDPVYNSLILKILEAKALDCLCTNYSKQNTQKQISQILAEINQRVDKHESDSVSVTSSVSVPDSYESPSTSVSVSDSYESPSSSVSSILTEDESISSGFITPQLYSPLNSAIQTPTNLSQRTSTIVSPDDSKIKLKSSLKLNEDINTPKKQSKVTILADKTSESSKLKHNKHSSSKHQKKSSKSTKKPTKHHTSSKSKKPTKHHSSSKPKTPTKHHSSSKPKTPAKHHTSSKSKTPTKHHSSSKSKKPTKHHSSSKSKKKKGSSKSPSKSKTHKSHHKKSTEPQSNNQVNDHETVVLPTFIYPQSYQELYRNQQRFLKLFLSSR